MALPPKPQISEANSQPCQILHTPADWRGQGRRALGSPGMRSWIPCTADSSPLPKVSPKPYPLATYRLLLSG